MRNEIVWVWIPIGATVALAAVARRTAGGGTRRPNGTRPTAIPETMTSDTVTVVRTELTDAASRELIDSLNAELTGLYPESGANHFRLDPDEVTEGRGVFLVVYRAGMPVGCGAVRLLDVETAEVKRMYVRPIARGSGLGRRLLAALEVEARALGVRRLVLETGIRQTAALALYRTMGFQPIPLFGEYRLSPETSVCLGKDLLNDEP